MWGGWLDLTRAMGTWLCIRHIRIDSGEQQRLVCGWWVSGWVHRFRMLDWMMVSGFMGGGQILN